MNKKEVLKQIKDMKKFLKKEKNIDTKAEIMKTIMKLKKYLYMIS